jgi:hypothetical protein
MTMFVISYGVGYWKRRHDAWNGNSTHDIAKAASWRTREASEHKAETLRAYFSKDRPRFASTIRVIEVQS